MCVCVWRVWLCAYEYMYYMFIAHYYMFLLFIGHHLAEVSLQLCRICSVYVHFVCVCVHDVSTVMCANACDKISTEHIIIKSITI